MADYLPSGLNTLINTHMWQLKGKVKVKVKKAYVDLNFKHLLTEMSIGLLFYLFVYLVISVHRSLK